MSKVVIIHNAIINNTIDELDVLVQKELIANACINLGNKVKTITIGDDLKNDIQAVAHEKPDLVFNIVEALWGKGELIYIAPAILNSLKIPYTGVPLDALFVTTNKVMAKKMMQNANLPTAPFYAINQINLLNPKKKYIVKPIWEEASVGISEDLIFDVSEKEKLSTITKLSMSHYFIEEFIEGREFNISILANGKKPEVLPAAEIIFSEYFDDKPKIVGYKAKWDEDSEEYKHTNRAFETMKSNSLLEDKLIDICVKTWNTFNLHGYARVDFRVDNSDNIFILEINGNPCISPDSGFIAAAHKAGYNNDQIIGRILDDINY